MGSVTNISRARVTKKQAHRKLEKAKSKGRKQPKPAPLAKLFAERDAAVRRGEYEILGRTLLLRTERGDIEFHKTGPFIARLKSGDLVVLNEWNGLPDMVMLLPELCDDCRTHCKSCDGQGVRLCMGVNCGGEGRQILTRKVCDAEGCYQKTEKVNKDCAECHGSGSVADQTAECPACKGEKVQACPSCQKTGRMPTGRVGGAAHDSGAELCPTCRGNGRKLQLDPQNYREYVAGILEGFTVIGPVHGILWEVDQERDLEHKMELCRFGPDEDGNLAALLVADPERDGQPQYLLGGVPTLQALK